jgi:SM-20-related protein
LLAAHLLIRSQVLIHFLRSLDVIPEGTPTISALPIPSLTAHFDAIADGLCQSGWILIPDFLSADGYLPLLERAHNLQNQYKPAGIGRGANHQTNSSLRTDSIFWLDSGNEVDRVWLSCMEGLRLALNRRLFLGLFEYEAHYACYDAGSFYRRHVDAFHGEDNRVLSAVLYLNTDWQSEDGGELVLYPDGDPDGLKLSPQGGALAVFLSEDFPHEVLCSARTRYSIAGWFRLNANRGDRLDPPR